MASPLRWDECARPEAYSLMLPEPQVDPAVARLPLQFLSALGRAVVIVLAFVGAYALWAASHGPAQLAMEPQDAGARVVATSASAERSQGFVTVTGDVVNHTGRLLKDVVAVVELRDGADHTVKLESALVGPSDLVTEQPVGFRVEMPDDSRAVSYSVRFRSLAGMHFD